MTQIDALRAMEKAVDAGDDRTDWMPWIDPLDRTRGILPYRFAGIPAAYNGSLDAAKALHDAVLPGWRFEVRSSNAEVWDSFRVAFSAEVIDNPARAWLLAIIRALIALEDKP